MGFNGKKGSEKRFLEEVLRSWAFEDKHLRLVQKHCLFERTDLTN